MDLGTDRIALLAQEAGIPLDAASAFLAGFRATEQTHGAHEREALKVRDKPGATRTFVSQNWSNFVLEWKSSLTQTVAALSAVAFAGSKHPIGGILAALQAYRTIVGLFEVEITGLHAKLVEILWFRFEDSDTVFLEHILEEAQHEDLTPGECEEVLATLEGLGLVSQRRSDAGDYVVKTDRIVA